MNPGFDKYSYFRSKRERVQTPNTASPIRSPFPIANNPKHQKQKKKKEQEEVAIAGARSEIRWPPSFQKSTEAAQRFLPPRGGTKQPPLHRVLPLPLAWYRLQQNRTSDKSFPSFPANANKDADGSHLVARTQWSKSAKRFSIQQLLQQIRILMNGKSRWK